MPAIRKPRPRDDAEQGGHAANSNSPSALSPTPRRTARSSRAPKIFCSSPGDTTNAGASSVRYVTACRPRTSSTPRRRRGPPRTASHPPNRGERQRQRDREADQLHGQLHDVDPGRREQAAGREVDRDDDAADGAADRLGMPRNDFEDPPQPDQLGREDEDRADPQQRRDDAAHALVVAELEVVARRCGGSARPRPAASPARPTRRARHSRSPPSRPTTMPRCRC